MMHLAATVRRPDLRHPRFRASRIPKPRRGSTNTSGSAVDAGGALLAFARDLLNSDYAGHRLTFQLFAQSPPFAHLLAVYNDYDFEGPADLVRRYAGLESELPVREDRLISATPAVDAEAKAGA